MTNEPDALDVPRDGVWRARIGILRNEVYQRLGDFQSEFENPPAKAGESEIGDFGRRLEQCGRRLDELWEVIEAEELRFVVEYPRALLGQYAPVPPHLKPLAGNFREAGDLWRHLGAGAAP